MIFFAIPNALLAIIAILSLGLEFGWEKLIQLPFSLLIAWLIYTVVFVFIYRWHEVSEDERFTKYEYEKVMTELKDTIIFAIKEGLKENERTNKES